MLLLRFLRFFKEKLRMMLLQRSEKVNISRDVDQKLRFFIKKTMISNGKILNISRDVGALKNAIFSFLEVKLSLV